MKDIVILHPRDIKKALPLVAKRAFSWFYLGQDIKQSENISQALGKENRYFIGDLLQEVAFREKQPYLDFIAQLGFCQKNKLCWWASNIAYRNPFLRRDLLLLWCYSAVFDKICSETERDEEGLLLILVEDRWLYRHLWEHCQKNGADLYFLSRKSVLPEILKSVIRGIAGRAYVLAKAAYHVWQLRVVSSEYRSQNGKENGKQIYIYSWVQDRFFRENGKFNDAYFGRLPEVLTNNNLNVAYITPPFLPIALKRKCVDCGEYEFIFLDQYINFSDILKCLFVLFRISYDSQQRWLRGLLWRQVVYEISSVPGHLLYYFAFKRWLKQISQKEIIIIYPFENQPWEKMLCLTAKESDKNIKLIGYQHSVVPSLLLNYFLGFEESNNMPLPDTIVANGEYTLELLKNAGYGEVELVNGGAFRYEHLHKTGERLTKREGKLKTVLVALPYRANLAKEMLSATFNAFKDLEKENIRIFIKPHPVVPLKRLKIQPFPWSAHFQKTDKPFTESLKEVDLLIYSSSTAGLEAFLAGVPVIKYCSGHIIDLDALDALDGTAVRSCSENNMKQVVLSALDGSNEYLAQQPAGSLDRLFSSVDEEVWKQIVKC